ncbi:MAG TPA: hypothetical protein VNC84_02920 [Gammaproteobacteria bacterium]|jgi:hypothetical protein|nr:hypothetical protein [Gammaproteobacteria bacterium]
MQRMKDAIKKLSKPNLEKLKNSVTSVSELIETTGTLSEKDEAKKFIGMVLSDPDKYHLLIKESKDLAILVKALPDHAPAFIEYTLSHPEIFLRVFESTGDVITFLNNHPEYEKNIIDTVLSDAVVYRDSSQYNRDNILSSKEKYNRQFDYLMRYNLLKIAQHCPNHAEELIAHQKKLMDRLVSMSNHSLFSAFINTLIRDTKVKKKPAIRDTKIKKKPEKIIVMIERFPDYKKELMDLLLHESDPTSVESSIFISIFHDTDNVIELIRIAKDYPGYEEKIIEKVLSDSVVEDALSSCIKYRDLIGYLENVDLLKLVKHCPDHAEALIARRTRLVEGIMSSPEKFERMVPDGGDFIAISRQFPDYAEELMGYLLMIGYDAKKMGPFQEFAMAFFTANLSLGHELVEKNIDMWKALDKMRDRAIEFQKMRDASEVLRQHRDETFSMLPNEVLERILANIPSAEAVPTEREAQEMVGRVRATLYGDVGNKEAQKGKQPVTGKAPAGKPEEAAKANKDASASKPEGTGEGAGRAPTGKK